MDDKPNETCFLEADKHRLLFKMARDGNVEARQILLTKYRCKVFSPEERREEDDHISR